jgi:hypothetical protein
MRDGETHGNDAKRGPHATELNNRDQDQFQAEQQSEKGEN